MNAWKRAMAALLTAVLLAVSLPGLDAALAAPSKRSTHGSFAAESSGRLYVALPDASGTSLYSLPAEGGDLTLIESSTQIDDLVAVDAKEYYVRCSGTTFQVVERNESGARTVVAQFESPHMAFALSWYEGALYCLVDNLLTRIDPASGAQTTVSDVQMTEYTIVEDMVYYVSFEDQETYESPSLLGDSTVSQSAGRLHAMRLDGSSDVQLLDKGISSLKAYDDNLYFHNLSDNYVMGSGDDEWLEGRLYRYNIQTNQLAPISTDYDWDFFPAAAGVVIYTSQNISLFTATDSQLIHLMSPELYTTLTVVGDSAIVFEHNRQLLTRLPLDGSGSSVLHAGELIPTEEPAEDEEPLEEDPETEDETSEDEEDAEDEEEDDGKDDGYIFPSSNKKKLTKKQILAIDEALWPYARNEIYARHGYEFDTKKFRDYFNKKSWYSPGGFSTSDLNSIEWYNMDLIKQMEKGSSGTTATDDSYIFPNSHKKKLTLKQVKSIKKSLLPYARNEIYARHGYEFDTKKYRDYFKKKSWYKPGGFSTSDLNSIEWYNMDLIKKVENGESTDGETGSDSSYIFPNSSKKKLTKKQIRAIDKSLLPYARNEIYARHGYEFDTKKYRDYFKKKSWYKPGGFSTSDLNSIEWYNMDLIKEVEENG